MAGSTSWAAILLLCPSGCVRLPKVPTDSQVSGTLNSIQQSFVVYGHGHSLFAELMPSFLLFGACLTELFLIGSSSSAGTSAKSEAGIINAIKSQFRILACDRNILRRCLPLEVMAKRSLIQLGHVQGSTDFAKRKNCGEIWGLCLSTVNKPRSSQH